MTHCQIEQLGASMSLTFAFKWDTDFNKGGKIKVGGAIFSVSQARKVLKDSLGMFGGDGLKTYIDRYHARVINGPHKSDDPRLHMTVLGLKAGVIDACFHVYVNKEGNAGGVSPAPTRNTGHVHDDRNVPPIANSDAL